MVLEHPAISHFSDRHDHKYCQIFHSTPHTSAIVLTTPTYSYAEGNKEYTWKLTKATKIIPSDKTFNKRIKEYHQHSYSKWLPKFNINQNDWSNRKDQQNFILKKNFSITLYAASKNKNLQSKEQGHKYKGTWHLRYNFASCNDYKKPLKLNKVYLFFWKMYACGALV